jgi:hypothetical protein
MEKENSELKIIEKNIKNSFDKIKVDLINLKKEIETIRLNSTKRKQIQELKYEAEDEMLPKVYERIERRMFEFKERINEFKNKLGEELSEYKREFEGRLNNSTKTQEKKLKNHSENQEEKNINFKNQLDFLDLKINTEIKNKQKVLEDMNTTFLSLERKLKRLNIISDKKDLEDYSKNNKNANRWKIAFFVLLFFLILSSVGALLFQILKTKV